MDQQNFSKATPGKKARLDLTNCGYEKSTPNTEDKSLCDGVQKSLPCQEAAAMVSLSTHSIRTLALYRAV